LAHPVAERARLRAWRQANPGKVNAQRRRQWFRNQASGRARVSRHHQKHRTELAAKAAIRRRHVSRLPEYRKRYWRHREQALLKSLRQRLKRQFGGVMPPPEIMEMREQVLMLRWEIAAARKAAA
jgi:hypothetical protein